MKLLYIIQAMAKRSETVNMSIIFYSNKYKWQCHDIFSNLIDVESCYWSFEYAKFVRLLKFGKLSHIST